MSSTSFDRSPLLRPLLVLNVSLSPERRLFVIRNRTAQRSCSRPGAASISSTALCSKPPARPANQPPCLRDEQWLRHVPASPDGSGSGCLHMLLGTVTAHSLQWRKMSAAEVYLIVWRVPFQISCESGPLSSAFGSARIEMANPGERARSTWRRQQFRKHSIGAGLF